MSSFTYIQEGNDAFLSLFPHRYDYIYAPYPELGFSPHWQTESRYPLSDRLIHQGGVLYGVRFGQATRYCLLDIDADSAYHPQTHPQAFTRVLQILEDVGLVSPLICCSSHSGGLHVYFPLGSSYASWELGNGLTQLLQNKGIVVRGGQLEVFPNAKTYVDAGQLSLFNAHRLPLQQDSYILDDSLEPIYSSELVFTKRWQSCCDRNVLDARKLARISKQHQYRQSYLSTKADKFLADLNIEIEPGWTDYGQTNRILGRIAMRAYIFHHVINGDEPLSGAPLAKAIVETAIALPGYQEWCRHQHEIEERASEWAKCVEASHYFPYGYSKGRYKTKSTDATPPKTSKESWNHQRAKATQEKIKQAVLTLIADNCFPATTTARFKALLQYGIGGASLYRYRYLWHPESLSTQEESSLQPPQLQSSDSRLDCVVDASNSASPTSLLLPTDSNPLGDEASSDFSSLRDEALDSNSVEAVRLRIRTTLKQTCAQQRQSRFNLHQSAQIPRQQAQSQVVLRRMADFLRSAEPILMVEAMHWLKLQPGMPNQLLDQASGALERWNLMEAIAMAEEFARLQWPAWQIRDLLVQQFMKDSLSELTAEERCRWMSYLQKC